jgi:UPF0755 protein
MKKLWLLGSTAALLVAAIAAFVAYHRSLDAPESGASAETREFTIPKGASLTQLGALLQQEGFIRSHLGWRIYTRLTRNLPAPKAGRHALPSGLDVPSLLEKLSQNPLSEDVTITLLEGWRLQDADQWLADQHLIEPGAYLDATQRPEGLALGFPVEGPSLLGYLLPESYRMPPGRIDVHALVQRQADAFRERFYLPYREEIEKGPRTLHQVVVMASMLEREEPKPDLRPTVAGLLYNRLDSGSPLGVDATSRFTLLDWNDRRAFLRNLRDPKDAYNTRLRTGLPPGPIAAPSLASLVSALRPQPTEFWYYLHDRDQNIHFARTAAEHESNRKRYDVW